MAVAMNTYLLDEITEAAKKFQELHKAGVLGFDYDGNVHVSESLLEAIPGEAEEEKINCEIYPYKISKYYDGVIFYALSEEGLRKDVSP